MKLCYVQTTHGVPTRLTSSLVLASAQAQSALLPVCCHHLSSCHTSVNRLAAPCWSLTAPMHLKIGRGKHRLHLLTGVCFQGPQQAPCCEQFEPGPERLYGDPGGIYVPDIQDGEEHQHWLDGSEYYGEWRNGQPNGRGIFVSTSGQPHVCHTSNTVLTWALARCKNGACMSLSMRLTAGHATVSICKRSKAARVQRFTLVSGCRQRGTYVLVMCGLHTGEPEVSVQACMKRSMANQDSSPLEAWPTPFVCAMHPSDLFRSLHGFKLLLAASRDSRHNH